MTTGGKVVKIQVPFPLLCFRLKARLFPALVISSELFITAKNCQEHSTRAGEEERETQQQKLQALLRGQPTGSTIYPG